jgi:hypothetical protein
VATAIVGTLALRSSRANYQSALNTEEQRAMKGIDSLQGIDAANVTFLHYLVTGDTSVLQTLDERYAAASKDAAELRDSSTTTAHVTGWTEAVRELSAWNDATQEAVEARRAGRIRDATQLYTDRVLPIRRQQRDLVVDLVASERARSNSVASDASSSALRSIWLLLGISAAALILAVFIALGLARAVTRHLRHAVGTLASASSDILAATQQQASGVTEQKTAIHQTTATTDEVRQTVGLTTEKAQLVARDAEETAEVSRDGRRAVDESIRGAQEAQTRMETIAERILALSEQGQAIGEIVATVNGLAEQSNLLAVNAGIEAAKAGEAGRGFGVVANEVKSLAEQSKHATAQIRGILNEIQGATQAAVLAAEQGVKASEAGAAVTSDAGDAIKSLGDRLTHAAQSAQQIVVSAQEQMTGMDQVSYAMRNIQEASTQNMASTRQVEQAARDLNALAGRLEALVAGRHNGAVAEHAEA